MHYQDRQILFYITGVVFTTPSNALSMFGSSSKLPRQEEVSQFVRRFYHGCEFAQRVI